MQVGYQQLKVKVKNPRFSLLEGLGSSGTILAVPIILYLLVKKLIFKKEEELVWRVQVFSKTGVLERILLHEEIFKSPDDAWRRFRELNNKIEKGETDFIEECKKKSFS